MLKKYLLLGIFVVVCGLFAGRASAIVIDVIPDRASVGVGDTVRTDVRISGLGLFSPPSLGVFDIDLQFDDSLFAAVGPVTYGDQLDLFGFGSIQSDFDFGNSINVFEVSFDLPGDLDTMQLDEFLLFSVEFEALAIGTGVFDLSINSLGDAFGDPLDATTNPATVQVVPLPAAAWLFASALLGLVGFDRRRKTA